MPYPPRQRAGAQPTSTYQHPPEPPFTQVVRGANVGLVGYLDPATKRLQVRRGKIVEIIELKPLLEEEPGCNIQ
jgi:hypothetical protein